MCQIYITRKVKIQGVPCCKNQSQYHISCHATSQVMFVCLLFERATFTRKPCKARFSQGSSHSPLPVLSLFTSFHCFWCRVFPRTTNIANFRLQAFKKVLLLPHCGCARRNNFLTSMLAFVVSKRLQLYLPWSISVSAGRQPSIIPVEKNSLYVPHQLSLFVHSPLYYPSPDWEFIFLDSLLTEIFVSIQPPSKNFTGCSKAMRSAAQELVYP